MGLSATAGWSGSLIATVDHVWGGNDRVNVTTAPVGAGAWPTVESYRVAPHARSARYLLPATSRRAAAGSIRSYNQLRLPRTRIARTVLGALVASGGERLLREQLRVEVDPTLSTDEYPDHVMTKYLAEELGPPGVHFALGVHAQTPNSKPTVQAFDLDGTPRGFAKIGWNSVTRGQVETETAALRHLAARRIPGVDTPELRHGGSWQDRSLLVTAPMPLEVRPWSDHAVAPTTAVLCAVAGAGPASERTVAEAEQVSRLRDRAGAPGWEPAVARAVVDLLDDLTARFPTVRLRFGAWHGDWVPWNLARLGAGLMVWDWEQFRERDVAIGLDALHWHFQVSFVLGRVSLGAALRSAYERARPALEQIQGADAAQACLALYALELTARYEDMRAAGAGPTDRFHSDVVSELAAISQRW